MGKVKQGVNAGDIDLSNVKKSDEGHKLNIWQMSTVILIVVVITLIIFNATGRFILPTFRKNNIDLRELGEKTINYINSNFVQPGFKAELKEVVFNESLGLYVVITEYMGNIIPVYVTSNGKYMILVSDEAILDLDKPLLNQIEEKRQVEIPKKERPIVKLFIFSYCPYGVQALLPFARVAKIMKDYADFYVKFFGRDISFEKQQNMIQECIIRLYPDKYWDYAIRFGEEIYLKCGGNVSCDLEESIRVMRSLDIDYNVVLECVRKDGEKYLSEEKKEAARYNLRGSPSFVINDVYVEYVVRSEEGIKSVVCQAFKDPPEVCNKPLSIEETEKKSYSGSGSC